MKRRRYAIALGVATLVSAFGTTCYLFSLKQQTMTLLAARRAPEVMGHHGRVQDTARQSTPVPDQHLNTATASSDQTDLLQPVEQARTVYNRLQEEILSRSTWDALRKDILSRPASSWSAADWERLNPFLAEHADLLAEIRAMASASGPLCSIDISKGYALDLSHLAPTRSLAQLLQAEAIARGHAGDYEGAAADILAGVQLGARLQEEPVLIAQMFNLAVYSDMYEAVGEAFPVGQIPDALAVELARQFHRSELSNSVRASMNSEQDFGLDLMMQIMDSGWSGVGEPIVAIDLGNDFAESLGGFLYGSPLARPWQHLDLQSYSRIMDEYDVTFSMPYYEASDELDRIAREVEDLPPTRVVTRAILPSVLGIHQAIARAEAQRQLFLLGAAIESYANEHGAYPTNLNDVQGLANGASTIDPFTGAPYHYRSSGNGFELYSVGRDLTDDGGRNDLRDGDIVWRGATIQ